MNIVKVDVHGNFKYFGKEGDKFFIPEYNKKKKKWEWFETIICPTRVKKMQDVPLQEVLRIVNRY